MRLKLVPLLAIAALAGCSKHVSSRDRVSTLQLLDAATTSYPGDRVRLLMEGCGEIPSCAQGCANALKAAVRVNTEEERGAVLAACSGFEFRELRKRDRKLSPDTWFEQQHMHAFLDRVQAGASEGDKAKLVGFRQKLNL